MVAPAPNAAIYEVSRQGTNVAHYVQLSGPVRTAFGSITYTLYRDLVCTCAFPTMLGMPCRHFWRVLRDDAFAAFHLGLLHSQYFLEDPPMHEELELMSRNVVGKLYLNHERVVPCPVEAPSVEGIVPEGEGEAALLVRQGEVQRIRNRLQLSALAREFVDVAIVSQERFQDARLTLRTWIDTQRKPLGDLKADNPAKPPTKAQKRKASEMATGGKKKKKNTAEPDVPPPSLPPPQVYVTPPFVPPFVPAYPPVHFANQPIHAEGSDDVVMLRKVPPRRGVPCGGQCATLANPPTPPREGGSLVDPAHDVRVARACALGLGNHGLQDLDVGVEGLPHTEPRELAVLGVGDGQHLVIVHGADQCCKKDTCSKVCQRQEARSQTPLQGCVTKPKHTLNRLLYTYGPVMGHC